MARVALSTRAAAQLIVNAPALMAFGAEHVKAASSQRLLLQARNLPADFVGARALLALTGVLDLGDFLADAHVGVAAELNIGAAAGHIGGDGDRTRHTGLRDDVGF